LLKKERQCERSCCFSFRRYPGWIDNGFGLFLYSDFGLNS